MIIIRTFLGTIITYNVQIFPVIHNLQASMEKRKEKGDCLIA